MTQMFITPMKVAATADQLQINSKQVRENETMFEGIFKQAVDDVVTSEQELTQQQYLLSTGQLDDAHTVPIAAANAQLSIDLLVQLRNKALEAYNEIMRINL